MKGKVIVFAAPSGSGKTTIVNELVNKVDSLRFSISATTRPKRANEIENQHYYFLSTANFKKKIDQGELLEWEEVYQGTYYGTLKSEIERIYSEGNHAILDLDVKGAIALKEKLGENALSIFIKVPSLDVLKQRLLSRGTENEKAIAMRIQKAFEEIQYEHLFDKVVVNKNLPEAINEARLLVEKFIGFSLKKT